ncbi:MAG: cyclic lactone autoinducer peptide [Clostridia bacterium]|nr:cyclic lactone autoinducer peptide [Clostridia bacterium]
MLKTKAIGIISTIVTLAAMAFTASASGLFFYQPKQPKSLK